MNVNYLPKLQVLGWQDLCFAIRFSSRCNTLYTRAQPVFAEGKQQEPAWSKILGDEEGHSIWAFIRFGLVGHTEP